MAVAGILAQYLSIKSQLSYAQLQDTRWNNMATAISKQLSKMEGYEEKWESSSDTAYEIYNQTDKELKLDGAVIKNKTLTGGVGEWNLGRVEFAEKYASKKVPRFDPERLEELANLDMEYSSMVAMYDTLVEELKAMEEGTKTSLSTEAGDNHIVGGS